MEFAWVVRVLELAPDTGPRLVALAPDLSRCSSCGNEVQTPWHRYCAQCPNPKRGRHPATRTPAHKAADRASTLRALALNLLGTAALRRLPSERQTSTGINVGALRQSRKVTGNDG